MKVIAIFFCILTGVFFTLETYGQKKEKESYKSFKLRSSSKDIDQLLSEAEALKLKNPRQALTKVQEALGMSLTQEDVFNEGRCYLLLGEINEKIDEWDLARENYQQAHQKLSGNFTSSPEFLKALKGLGDANLKLGNHEAALQNYQEALKLRLRSTEKTIWLLDISEVYYQMGNYDEALKTLEQQQASKDLKETADKRI